MSCSCEHFEGNARRTRHSEEGAWGVVRIPCLRSPVGTLKGMIGRRRERERGEGGATDTEKGRLMCGGSSTSRVTALPGLVLISLCTCFTAHMHDVLTANVHLYQYCVASRQAMHHGMIAWYHRPKCSVSLADCWHFSQAMQCLQPFSQRYDVNRYRTCF